MDNSTVAFEVNDNTPETRFLASLSDGRTVIQDDVKGYRHAWVRLAAFLQNNPEIKITCLRLQAPGGHDIPMPANQKGYFFGNMHRRIWPGGYEETYLGIGYYDGSQVVVRWYNNKNFSRNFAEQRTKDKAGFCLIENNG